jgi:hypothetical protein
MELTRGHQEGMAEIHRRDDIGIGWPGGAQGGEVGSPPAHKIVRNHLRLAWCRRKQQPDGKRSRRDRS